MIIWVVNSKIIGKNINMMFPVLTFVFKKKHLYRTRS
jgi:hypothetical protein